MKKIFLLLVLSFACLFVLAGCEGFVIPGVTPTTPQETEPEKEELSSELKSARSYLIQLYGDGSEKATPADYYRISTVTGLPIEWSVNSEKVSVELVEEGENAGMTKVSVSIGAEEVKYILSAKVVDSQGNELVLEFNCLIPAAEASTIADFISAADTESFKALTGVVTAVNKVGDKGSFVITDETGSIFSYDSLNVTLGDKITVVGQLSLYNGAFPQLTGPSLIEVVSTGNDVKAASGELVQVTAEQIKADVTAGTLIEKYAGKYLEITGYAMLTSTGYVNLKATLADTDPCVNLYANSAIGLTKDYAETKVKVYGFMRGTGSSYLTLQVQSFEVVEEELTPEQMLQKAMNGVTLETTEFAENAEVQLPTSLLEGTVTLSWELVGDAVDAFAITEGKLVVKAEKNATQTLKVTATMGEIKATKEFTLVVETSYEVTPIAKALEVAEKAGSAYTTEKYVIAGTVNSIANEKYGNIYVTDGTNEIYVYGVYIEGKKYGEFEGAKFAEGDVVVVKGVLGAYTNKDGVTTLQMKNADLVTWENATKYETISYEKAAELGLGADDPTTTDKTESTTEKYTIKGVVTSVANTKYGNAYIKDIYGNEFYVYGMYTFDGATRYDAMTNAPVVGDFVVVQGVLTSYKGSAQMKNGWLLQANDVDYAAGESDPVEPEEKPEDPTQEPAVSETTVAALAATAPTTSKDVIYVVEGIWQTKAGTAPSTNTYGNGNLLDEAGKSIVIYGLSSTKAACLKWENGAYVYSNAKDFLSLNVVDGTIVKVGMVYDTNFKNYSAYLIEIKGSVDLEEEEIPTAGNLTKVTNVDQLTDGAQIVLASGTNIMGSYNAEKAITNVVALEKVEVTSDVQIVTLVKSGDNWLLQIGADEYLSYTGSKNNISVTDNPTTNSAKWTITITDGIVSITNVGTPERLLQYNASSPRFVCYKGTQANPEVYIYTE